MYSANICRRHGVECSAQLAAAAWYLSGQSTGAQNRRPWVRSPVALPKLFPFLRPMSVLFFFRLVCWVWINLGINLVRISLLRFYIWLKCSFFDSPKKSFLLLNLHEIWRNGRQLANIVSGKIWRWWHHHDGHCDNLNFQKAYKKSTPTTMEFSYKILVFSSSIQMRNFLCWDNHLNAILVVKTHCQG